MIGSSFYSHRKRKKYLNKNSIRRRGAIICIVQQIIHHVEPSDSSDGTAVIFLLVDAQIGNIITDAVAKDAHDVLRIDAVIHAERHNSKNAHTF